MTGLKSRRSAGAGLLLADNRSLELKRGPLPIYYQIFQIIRNMIASGSYPPGAQLPTDDQFMRDFGVSRHTVRAALQRLVDDGIIERHPGKGSFVVDQADVASAWTIRSVNDILNDKFDTQRKVLFAGTVRAADHRDAARAFQIVDSAELFMLHIIRFTASGPHATSNVYIPIEFAKVPAHCFEHDLVMRVLEERFHVRAHKMHIDFTAALADRRTSELLHISRGSAVLAWQQTFYAREGSTLQFTRAQYRPDRRPHRLELYRDSTHGSHD